MIEKNEDDEFSLKMIKKEAISPDTYEMAFEFPNPEWIMGLFPAGHLFMHADIDGKRVTKKYTPISPVNEKGTIVFVIKVYRPCEEFPNGGQFTTWMEKNVNVGDSLLFSGPIGMIKYHGYGQIEFKKKMLETKKTKIGLLAGGSGITPMYSIALASSLAKDGVAVTLIFSNKTKDDILCKKELDALEAMNPNCKVVHTLTRHKEEHGEWNGEVGRITAAMFQKYMPAHADDVFIALCGNKGFCENAAAILDELGYVSGVSRP